MNAASTTNVQLIFPQTASPESIENMVLILKLLRRKDVNTFASQLPDYIREFAAPQVQILTRKNQGPAEKSGFLAQLIKPWSKKAEPELPPTPTLTPNFSISWGPEDTAQWSKKHLMVLTSDQENTPGLIEAGKTSNYLLCDSKWLHKRIIEKTQLSERQVPFIYPCYKKEIFHANQKSALRENARQSLQMAKNIFVVAYPEGGWTPPADTDSIQYLPLPADNGHNNDLKQRALRLHAADIYVNPQTAINFQTLTLHAMACGLPVLVSTNDLASEIVYSKQTLLKSTDKDDVIARIQELSEQKDWLKSVGRQNSEVAVLCDENHYHKRVDDLLHTFLGN